MENSTRLSDMEYEKLSIMYEQSPPRLSGQPGFLSHMRETRLINELLPPDYARIVTMKSKTMRLSPADVIQHAIKEQLMESV